MEQLILFLSINFGGFVVRRRRRLLSAVFRTRAVIMAAGTLLGGDGGVGSRRRELGDGGRVGGPRGKGVSKLRDSLPNGGGLVAGA